VSKRRTNW